MIGGYTPSPRDFDALLVGYYEDRKLIYLARVRNGLVAQVRDTVFSQFMGLGIQRCPFANLPEPKTGRSGDLSAEDIKKCRWLRPRLVGAFEYLEWTPANHLRHPNLVALREDKRRPRSSPRGALEAS